MNATKNTKCGWIAFVFAFACGPQDTHVEAQMLWPRIINGTPTRDFPAVGMVGSVTAGNFCTGTLIDSRHVLTAAHCGEAMLQYGTEAMGTFELNGEVYLTNRIYIHPDYDPRTLQYDIAILELSEEITTIEPMQISLESPLEGDVVMFVGFGEQGTPESGGDGTFGEKLVGLATIDAVLDTIFLWTFDDVTESNAAPGDSGGPVLAGTGDAMTIVGIVSAGTTADAGLGDTTYLTRVDAFVDWITATVAGATPNDDGDGENDADGAGDDENDAGHHEGSHCSHEPLIHCYFAASVTHVTHPLTPSRTARLTKWRPTTGGGTAIGPPSRRQRSTANTRAVREGVKGGGR